jgi:NAD(P)H-quinone oxidoreductase subunit 5
MGIDGFQWAIQNIWMVPLYPLIASVLIMLGRGIPLADGQPLMRPKQLAMILTVVATAFGLFHSVAALNWMFHSPQPTQAIEQNWTWLHAGPLTLSVGTLLDNMSVMMLFVVTFISLWIQIYTHGYMSHDKGYAKFYAYLALFNFSMLGLVLSTNLIQMYMFWELVGVSSYLLIGFWFHKPAAGLASMKAFLTNRVGDFGLLLGILSFLFFGLQWWLQSPQGSHLALLSFSGFAPVAQVVLNAVGPAGFAVIALLIFMGPMAKSAQIPLHIWLPDAMEGPTPISALIHAATMVAAGIYLVARVYPIFELSPIAMTVVAYIGVATALIAATIALTQTDIKKALAYSTMSQLGFMMAAMGIGAYSAGLFHLFTHAFFKAMLFLCSGSVIHALHDEQDMRHMGGLFKHLPITGLTYLIGTLSISGFFLSGFWSKDEILLAAQSQPIIYGLLSFTAGLTAFYMFRTFFMTFTGKYRGHHPPHHEDPWMVLPLVVLAVPSVIIGFALSGHLPGFPSFEQYIHYGAHAEALHEPHAGFLGLNPVAWSSLAIGVLGAFVSFLFYGPKPVFSSQLFKKQFPGAYQLFSKKWYFDELAQGFLNKLYMPFARLSSGFDKGVIDGLVNGSGQWVLTAGATLRQLQSGRIQTYVATIFYFVVVLSLVYLYGLI